MAKLTRFLQKQFASAAGLNQIGKFGSLAAGTPQYTTDADEVQDLSNFLGGWYDAIVGNNAPAIQDMNGLFFLAFRQLAYLFQAGIAEYNSETTYYIGSVVSTSSGTYYQSIADDNLNNAVTDTTKWRMWLQPDSSSLIRNLGITATVASNALTVAITNKSGGALSTTDFATVGYRSSTATLGQYAMANIPAGISMVVSNGSTLGQRANIASYIYVYLIWQGSAFEVALSRTYYDPGSLVSTTAEGGSGGADSSALMYSTTARANVPCIPVGRLFNSQATPGAWVSAMTEIALTPFEVKPVAAKATLTGNQAIGTTAFVKVAFAQVTGTNDFDPWFLFDTANNRFIARKAGPMTFYAQLTTNNYTSNEVGLIEIRKNNVSAAQGANSMAATNLYMIQSITLDLAVGDYVEVFMKSTADTAYDVLATSTLTYFMATEG